MTVPVHWQEREPPLPAGAVVAQGAVARALAMRLLHEPDETLARFTGVGGEGLLVLLGDDLPWVDGVVYLGNDDGLWLPTTRRSDVPAALLRRALEQRHGRSALAVLPPLRIFSVADARTLVRADLERWLARAAP